MSEQRVLSKYEKIVYGLMILMVIGLVLLVNIDVSGHKMKFKENQIIVYGNYIDIDDVISVELLDEVDIRGKIVGTNTHSYNRGTFQLGDNIKGNVYVYNDSKPYIRLTTLENIIIYNDKESSETKETYNKILEVCDIEGTENLNSNLSVPKESIYDENEKILSLLAGVIPTFAFGILMPIYCFRSNNPVHFWSGTVVRKDEISNIKAYNRANGFMWLGFMIWIITPQVISFIYEDIGFGVSSLISSIVVGFVGMIICYKKIYNKYKAK